MRLTPIIAMAILAAILGLVALWIAQIMAPFGVARTDRIAVSLLIAVGLLVAALGCSSTYDRGKLRPWMISGVCAAVVAFATWQPMIWGNVSLEGSYISVRLLLSMMPTIWTALMMLVGLLFIPRITNPWFQLVRWITTLLLIILSGHMTFWISRAPIVDAQAGWQDMEAFMFLNMRVFGILSILSALGMIIVWASRFLSMVDGQVPEHERFDFSLKCPRCGEAVVIRSGGDACSRCALKITVTPT